MNQIKLRGWLIGVFFVGSAATWISSAGFQAIGGQAKDQGQKSGGEADSKRIDDEIRKEIASEIARAGLVKFVEDLAFRGVANQAEHAQRHADLVQKFSNLEQQQKALSNRLEEGYKRWTIAFADTAAIRVENREHGELVVKTPIPAGGKLFLSPRCPPNPHFIAWSRELQGGFEIQIRDHLMNKSNATIEVDWMIVVPPSK